MTTRKRACGAPALIAILLVASGDLASTREASADDLSSPDAAPAAEVSFAPSDIVLLAPDDDGLVDGILLDSLAVSLSGQGAVTGLSLVFSAQGTPRVTGSLAFPSGDLTVASAIAWSLDGVPLEPDTSAAFKLDSLADQVTSLGVAQANAVVASACPVAASGVSLAALDLYVQWQRTRDYDLAGGSALTPTFADVQASAVTYVSNLSWVLSSQCAP